MKDFSPVNIEDRKKIGVRSGDTVKVHQKIKDKDKYRTQIFEGIVIATKHGTEPGATFTVRRAGAIGVERIYPLFSPMIDKIEIVKRAKVRRAKLYYIREKVAREIRRQMRRARIENISSVSMAEEEVRAAAEVEQAAKDAEAAAAKQAEEEAAKAEVEAKKVEEVAATEEKEEVEVEPAEEVVEEVKEEAVDETPAEEVSVEADDLTKVEGIGPKIAETLTAAGIATFAELAKTEVSKIDEVIVDVRGSHPADTWPKQAEMAAEGKWDELKTWQDELDGGKE